jgi:hypothetical protein
MFVHQLTFDPHAFQTYVVELCAVTVAVVYVACQAASKVWQIVFITLGTFVSQWRLFRSTLTAASSQPKRQPTPQTTSAHRKSIATDRKNKSNH